ncbi:hypothetical protein [Thermus tengchongensis]|nr:hypothetical protein [Thermus tengchongensis]
MDRQKVKDLIQQGFGGGLEGVGWGFHPGKTGTEERKRWPRRVALAAGL